MQPLSERGYCFVCGPQNARGMGVTWYSREDGSIFTEIILTNAQQCPPSLVHGGVSVALLDEDMGVAIWRAGFRSASENLNVTYQKPCPLEQKSMYSVDLWRKKPSLSLLKERSVCQMA